MTAPLPLLSMEAFRRQNELSEDRRRKAEWRAHLDRCSLAAAERVRAEAAKIIAGWRADPSTMPALSSGNSDRATYVVGRGFVSPDSY